MKLFVGPCQIETLDHALMMADMIKAIAESLQIEIVYKSSFDKANRTHGFAQRGAGVQSGLDILALVRRKIGIKVMTDVHESEQCAQAALAVDILQIPAMLCRQTDLIQAAARTGQPINIKKGQFLDPHAMVHAVAKARMAGAEQVFVTERGTTFGYQDLVVDMRSFPIMKQAGSDGVIFDATHSVQRPGGDSYVTGGDRVYSEPLARAAIAAGADGLFIETHQDPDSAPSDGAVMMRLDLLHDFLGRMLDLHAKVQSL